ncbi:MAG: hypothetical protein VR64_17625 [Desulfatitalea sp. BRH_c12]|nr:MAG: hypothetical protein VR64_17625 [Desulfatitalea sp. BRH_c12]
MKKVLGYWTGVMVLILMGCSDTPTHSANPVRQMAIGQFDRMITSADFSGLVVVVAAWCPPCREELPDVARLYRGGLPEGLKIVALSLDEGDAKPVQRLVADLNLPFPVYMVGMPAAAHYKIVGVPSVMTVKAGRILEKIPGRQTPAQLTARIKSLTDTD